jgi:hypothetical protein
MGSLSSILVGARHFGSASWRSAVTAGEALVLLLSPARRVPLRTCVMAFVLGAWVVESLTHVVSALRITLVLHQMVSWPACPFLYLYVVNGSNLCSVLV